VYRGVVLWEAKDGWVPVKISLRSNEEIAARFHIVALDLVPALEIGQGNVQTSSDAVENGITARMV